MGKHLALFGMNPIDCFAFALSQPEWQLALGAATLAGGFSYGAYARSRDSRWRLRYLYGTALAGNVLAAFSLATVACVLFLKACSTSFMTVTALALPLSGALTLALWYFYGHRALALAHGARPLADLELHRLVRTASEAASVAEPLLYYFDSGELRVFSSSGRSNALFLSVGALEALSRGELGAVLAHEIEHLRNRDPLKKLAVRLALAPGFVLRRVVREHEHRADEVAARLHAGALEDAVARFTAGRS